MPASARRKAFVLSAVLILVSLTFVVAAAQSTTSALAPFRKGADYPHERPLSRFAVPVGIVVGAVGSDGEPAPAAGAEVRLVRLQPAEVPLPSQSTGEHGRAIFHVPRGEYRVEVSYGEWTAAKAYTLEHPLRLAVVFDETGAATWRDVNHRDLERRGDAASLLVRVGAQREGAREPAPAAGAEVRVYRTAGEGRELVREGSTNERGAVLFHLHKGAYFVEVEWNNHTGSARVPLRQDARVFFVDDGDSLQPYDPPNRGDHGRPAARGPR